MHCLLIQKCAGVAYQFTYLCIDLFFQTPLLTIQTEMGGNYAAYVQMTKVFHVIILILFKEHAQKTPADCLISHRKGDCL